MTNQHAVARLVIWSVVAVVLVGIFIACLILGGGGFSLWKQGENREITRFEEEGTGLQAIDIRWTSGTVRVSPTDGERITAVESSPYEGKPMECSLTDGTLTISQKRNWGIFFFGIGPRKSDLELSVPRKEYESFALKATSGEIDIRDITASDSRYTLTSGDLHLTDITADSLQLKLTSGDIHGSGIAAGQLTADTTSGGIDIAGAFRRISGKTTSGNVKIESRDMPDALDYGMTSGDVTLLLPENEGFSLTCKKTSGRLHSDFDLLQPMGKDNRYIYKEAGGRDFTVSMTSGTFSLLKKDGAAESAATGWLAGPDAQ